MENEAKLGNIDGKPNDFKKNFSVFFNKRL